MKDHEAKFLLDRTLGPKVPEEVLVGLQGVGLLIGNYGYLAQQHTHHWLGYAVRQQPEQGFQLQSGGWIPVYDTAEEGVRVFCRTVIPKLAQVLDSQDIGKLAWELLVKGIVPTQPTDENWSVVTAALRQAMDRIQAGGRQIWRVTSFRPPILRRTWTHRQALQDLQRYLPQEASTQQLLGLLAWASLSSSYGVVSGSPTCNWGLLGKPGKELEQGFVMHESGEFLVQVMDANTGIQSFLELATQHEEIFAKADTGQLAKKMLEIGAFGVRPKITKELWENVCKSLAQSMAEISRETGLPNRWEVRSLVEQAKPKPKSSEVQKTDQKPEEPSFLRKAAPWLVGTLAIVSGVFAYKHFTQPEEPKKITPQDKKPAPEESEEDASEEDEDEDEDEAA